MTIKTTRRPDTFDLIIAGAGHAGCEAALAAANLGLSTLLVTSNLDHVGLTSCNPAIGGLGKGHMVREIDALGGYMGRWSDEAAIQVRTLNASKGPAVQATRMQIDRNRYMQAVKKDIFNHPNLYLTQGMVEQILVEDKRATGVRCEFGQTYLASAVLITAGTFLSGRIHVGDVNYSGGRFGDTASTGLSACLRTLGFTLGRFMTCTTPRVLTSSIDFSKMDIQPGDIPTPRFSITGSGPTLPQLSCHLTWTTPRSHEIIRNALFRSPMYNGAIPGTGPRYCPSIEDKIARFPHKERHQVFVEPEGLDSPETYLNNIPTGLPFEVQRDLLHSLSGFENCHIMRPGYAIEYDMIHPTQLFSTLETKLIPGLWCAGQINGTSGYEEAAAQGLWAALNIAAALQKRDSFLPGRNESYISVMVDDLVTKGTNEPYRMFTSRAEHRLLLRESNADMRLTTLGRMHGLVKDTQWRLFCDHKSQAESLIKELEQRTVRPDAALRSFLEQHNENPPATALPMGELLRRPALTVDCLKDIWAEIMQYSPSARLEAETHFKYAGYIKRQEELAHKQKNLEHVQLPSDLDIHAIAGLTTEIKEKLLDIKPSSLGQAGRIAGMTPAALACIEVHLKKLKMHTK